LTESGVFGLIFAQDGTGKRIVKCKIRRAIPQKRAYMPRSASRVQDNLAMKGNGKRHVTTGCS
jgi:hypothetical protein